jgi:hypothetical protein
VGTSGTTATTGAPVVPADKPRVPSPPARTAPDAAARAAKTKDAASKAAPVQSIVQFDKVRMVTRAGVNEREVDVLLRLEGPRLAVIRPGTLREIRSVAYQDIRSATYAQRRGGGFLGRGTRHWLDLEGVTGPLTLHLDKSNAPRIVSELERRWGHAVTIRTNPGK